MTEDHLAMLVSDDLAMLVGDDRGVDRDHYHAGDPDR